MNLYISKTDSSNGKKIVVDDMILTTHLATSGGSKMLDGYMSLFEAEVVTKLKNAGYDIYAKANTGEFGIDFLGETSYYGEVLDENGNLSNAVAEIIKSGEAEAAVVLDVNGAYERAASLSNLVFIKPTYGTVSRFGTIPAACSGETVGVMAKTTDKCKEILSCILGHDDKDGTSLPDEKCTLENKKEIKKIAVAKALFDLTDADTKALIQGFGADVEICELSDNMLLNAKAAWNVLMSAELCNNVSRYDGVKYGHRSKDYKNIDELYTNSRTEAFGYLAKSTILYGSDSLSTDNYMKKYDKALRVRRVISEYLNDILSKYDAVLVPATTKRAYTKADADANKYIAYDESVFTAPAFISGLPEICVNGAMLLGSAFSDADLLDFASKIEKEGK